MSIEKPDVIDGLGTDKLSGAPVLTISDHLQWNKQHLSMLEAKLASYLRFIESGQLAQHLPTAPVQQAVIRLVCKYRPTTEAVAFLSAADNAVSARGVGFQYGPLPNEDYSYEG